MAKPGNPNHDPKTGEFTSAHGGSGHNAGGGNRAIADHIKAQHLSLQLESRGQQDHPAFKSFKIKQGDKHVGTLHTESYGKRIEINDVESFTGPNSLGHSHMRSLAKELKKHWPEMETVGGFRMSGTRSKRGGNTEVKIK